MPYTHQVSSQWGFQQEVIVPMQTKKFPKRLQKHAWQERRPQATGKHSPSQSYRAVTHQQPRSCWNPRNWTARWKSLEENSQTWVPRGKPPQEITQKTIQDKLLLISKVRDNQAQLLLRFHYRHFSKQVKSLTRWPMKMPSEEMRKRQQTPVPLAAHPTDMWDGRADLSDTNQQHQHHPSGLLKSTKQIRVTVLPPRATVSATLRSHREISPCKLSRGAEYYFRRISINYSFSGARKAGSFTAARLKHFCIQRKQV